LSCLIEVEPYQTVLKSCCTLLAFEEQVAIPQHVSARQHLASLPNRNRRLVFVLSAEQKRSKVLLRPQA
jgi:hypothetical protein